VESSTALFNKITKSVRTLVLVFPSGLGLLAALDAGTLVVLSFANLSKNARLSAAALKTLQGAVDVLALFDMNFRHLYFPPSRMPGKPQHLRAITYGFNKFIILVYSRLVKRIF
jgi:hypothetical protein